MITLESSRLILRTASVAELRAELESSGGLAGAVDCPVAHDWPPQHWDRGAIGWLLSKWQESPEEPFWRSWYVQLRGGPIVGCLGCKGPPAPGGDPMVEIGYGLATSHWRQGIATEAVTRFLQWLGETGRVTRVCAHTLVGDPASGGVLRKTGFTLTGTAEEDGVQVDHWERRLV